MKIALVGYGKMGSAISEIAVNSAHEVTFTINSKNIDALDEISKENTDVVIEATNPDVVISNLEKLIPKRVPIVVATTGWHDKLGDIEEQVIQNNSGLVYGSNFSIGVGILFKINRLLASIMNRYPHYDCYIEERHHRYKKDAPSGTAERLAHELITHLDRKTSMVLPQELEHRSPFHDELSISSIRAGEICGEHRIVYTSNIDHIEVLHQAYNRKGFALGALTAAEWIFGKTGMYEFSETIF